jgi:putative tryptophan/tyrosine transport system substrate-binding protein
MKKKITRLAVCALLFALCSSVQAQQPTKIPRIGFLTAVSVSSFAGRTEAFRQGLRDLGYVEGKNIVIEYRYGDGKTDRLNQLADELVHIKVDIIVTGGAPATISAKDATRTIPIVMASDADPVGSGIVASLARPGGNITGFSTLATEIGGKRLELLKEIVPRLSHMAVFGTSTYPGNAQALKEMEVAAGAFGVKLQYRDVLDPKEIDAAFREASKARVGAVLVLASSVLLSQRTRITDLVIKNRVPAIYPNGEHVEDGGLMSYGPNIVDLFRRAATGRNCEADLLCGLEIDDQFKLRRLLDGNVGGLCAFQNFIHIGSRSAEILSCI